MEIQEFIKNFAAQFEETYSASFTPETKFRDIEEWSSLIALSIIAMVDEEYNVKIKGDEIRGCKTINEIYAIVMARL